MPVPIAELFISVSADVSGALAGLNSVNDAAGRTASSFDRARPAALAFTAAGAGIGAGFFKAISVTNDFDKAIAGVRANMSSGEVDQFGAAIRQLALDLGEGTSFNAREAAAGIEELLKAGIPAEAILRGAGQAALDLAAATGSTVADAGAIAASAMNAFGLSVEQLPGIVNTLTGVTVTTQADMNDLKLGISDVASVAAGFGLSMEDTAISLGIFRDAGLTGNTAGTALKTMLVGLQPQTKKDIALFNQLGLTVNGAKNAFFDQNGTIKDTAQIAGELRRALGGMNDAQRQATLIQLFGTQGFQAANILYEQGAEGVRKYTAEVGKIDAATVAAARLNSLAGDVEKLNGAIQKAQITIGDIFTPSLRRLAQRATELVKAFNSLSPTTQRNITLFIAIAGAAAFLLGSLVLLAPFIVAFPAALGAMAGALALLAPIFGVVALAATALVVAWRRDLGGIQEIVRSAFERLPGLIDATRVKIDELRDSFSGELTSGLSELQTFIDTKLEPALAKMRDRFDELNVSMDPFSAKVATVNTSLRENAGLFAIIGGAAGGAALGFGGFQLSLGGIGNALLAARVAGGLFSTVIGGLPALAGLLGGPVGVAAVVIGALAGAFLVAYNNNQQFKDGVDGLVASLDPLKEATSGAFDSLVKLANDEGPKVLEFFQKFTTDVLGQLGKQKDSLAPFAASLGNMFGSLANLLSALGQTGAQALGQLFNDVLIPAFEALKTILAPLMPLLQPILDFLGKVFEGFTIGKALQPATDFFNALANSFNTIAEFVKANPLPAGTLEKLFNFLPGAGAFGAAGAAAGAQMTPAGFTPGGGGGASVIFNGPISINGGVELEQFAAAIAGAAGRVNAPPDNSGNPGLTPVFS